MQSRHFDAVVLSRRDLTERIATFTIGAVDGCPLPLAEAGSHIELRFGGGAGRFLRHYSVVGPLTDQEGIEPFWRIAVQREDRARGSAYLHAHARPGMPLRISNPISAFRLTRDQPHTLLLAGGIGITPLVPMARALRLRRASFTMVYAGLDRGAMAFTDEVGAICGDRLRIHETRTAGLLDLTGLLRAQPEGTVAYICGPAAMIEALRKAGQALGWARDRIRFEVFNTAHKPEDQDFAVRLASGRLIAVGAGTTILDALENAGVDVLADCRRGECGLCGATVRGCDGSLDHRDRYFSDEEHALGRQMTICCSRITGKVLDLEI